MTSDPIVPLLHVGFYKTASTWLQRHFFKPERGFDVALNPIDVQLAIIDPPPFAFSPEPVLDKLKASAARCGAGEGIVPTITSEALSGSLLAGGFDAQINADRLKLVCPRAKVLFVVREQNSMIRSIYKTMVMWGLPHSIGRLLEFDIQHQRRAPGFSFDFIRYDKQARYYRQLYGADNVTVLPYELFKDKPRVFLNHIYRLSHGRVMSEQEWQSFPVKTQVNTNFSLTILTLQQLFNRFILQTPQNYSGMLKETLERFESRSRFHNQSLPRKVFSDAYLERRFANIVTSATEGQFVESNRQLQSYCKFDLKEYGYSL